MGALAFVMGVLVLFGAGFAIFMAGRVYREAARAVIRPVFLLRRQLIWRLA